MSNPIDQKREALPELKSWPAFADALGLKFGMNDTLWDNALSLYQKITSARAAVQPAGVAVPEAVEVAAYITRPSRMTMDGWEDGDEYAVIASEASEADKRYDVPLMTVAQHNHIVAMLAAAPHPVSGEQRPTDGENK